MLDNNSNIIETDLDNYTNTENQSNEQVRLEFHISNSKNTNEVSSNTASIKINDISEKSTCSAPNYTDIGNN